MIDVESTAQAIDDMSRRLEHTAGALRRTAELMRLRKDLNYAAEAITEFTNLVQNARLDLLVIRPIRELSKLS